MKPANLDEPVSSDGSDKTSLPTPQRIWTQIHRRKKAKATLPLADEWSTADNSPPTNLRMPSAKMSRNS